MLGLDHDTCDGVALKLSGLIGVFDLLVSLTMGESGNSTMSDFAFFMSKELQGIYKTVSGVEYNG